MAANDPVQLDLAPLHATLKKMHDNAPKVRRRGLALWAEALVGEAQFDAPVITGDLKSSHLVDHSNPDAPRIGATMQYAAAAHERSTQSPRWFLRAILEKGAELGRKALEKALAEGPPR